MNKLKISFLLLALFFCATLNAQENAQTVWLRYENVKGTPQKIRVQSPTLENIRVGQQYIPVSDEILTRLKRRECATYRYDIKPEESAQHYVAKVRTKKNAIGLSASYYFYGKMPWQRSSWIQEDYIQDFDKVSFHLKDFSGGLYYARQLCAKNRHRFSLELTAAYRQTAQELSADRYTTSYTAIDPDNETYTRLITVTNYQENQLMRSISIPLSFRYDWFMSKHLSLFISAGIQNDFTFHNSTTTNYDFSCAGKYSDEFFQTTIDQNGFYDFGQYPGIQFEETEKWKFLYTLYGTAAIGLQLYLGNTFSIEICGVYHKMVYRNFERTHSESFRLAESVESHQDLRNCLAPFAVDRFSVNAKLKISY